MYQVKKMLFESALYERNGYEFALVKEDEIVSEELLTIANKLKNEAEKRFMNLVGDEVSLHNVDLFDLFGIERTPYQHFLENR